MGFAKACKCGHIKTDHKLKKGDTERTGPCDWINCDCKEFKFVKFEQTVYPWNIDYGDDGKTPLIDCRNNPANRLDANDKTRPFKLTDCDSKGRARSIRTGYHKMIFNNGEYP